MQHHVFLSYSRKDSLVMEQVRQSLRDVGLSVWTDEGIEPGTPLWKDSIEEAIENAGCVVVLLSPDAKKSIWVKRELEYSGVQNLTIFPVMVRGEENNAIPFALIGAQFIDIRSDYEKNIKRLITTLQKRLKVVEPLDPVGAGFKPPPTTPPSQIFVPPDLSAILPPPFDWREIPAGQVTLEAGGYVPEGGQTFDVPAFYIAQYPITNAQFEVFVTSKDGYADPHWWDYSDDAEAWRKGHVAPPDTAFQGNRLPRTNVTWYEAVAFCRWLNEKWIRGFMAGAVPGPGWHDISIPSVTLPTEQQWQRAAQGDDGRKFPWGNTFEKEFCNSNMHSPTPVTQFERGASPYGVVDMVGNVWEWCITEWGTDEVGLQNNKERVLRGRAYYASLDRADVRFRTAESPSFANSGSGFRLAAILK